MTDVPGPNAAVAGVGAATQVSRTRARDVSRSHSVHNYGRPEESAESVAAFEAERPRLRALAYRMLATADDADDVVQDAWLRFAPVAHTVERPAAWLTTVVTRLAIDRLRVTQRQRQQYVGPWLAEPVIEELTTDERGAADPEHQAILAESLTFGFLAVLERLSPLERAVFLLHDVFAVPMAEVAATIERSDVATRQLAKRARDHLQSARPRYAVDPHDVEALSDAFFLAALEGDLVQLEAMLHDDVVQINDGGSQFRASRRPVVGSKRVARFVINLMTKMPPGAVAHKVQANGQFGYYLTLDGRPFMVIVMTWVDGRLASSHGVRNEHKLAAFHRAWLAAQPSPSD